MIIDFDQLAAWALFMQSLLSQVAIVPMAIGVLYLLIVLRGD
jgi:hypothetical protein